MSTPQYQNLIGGEWVAGATWTRDINPSDTNDVIGEYAQADVAQTTAAIAAARAAAPAWAASNIQARAEMLEKAGLEMIARKDELGRLLSREEGKTLAEGMGEVVRAGNVFKFFAGEVLRRSGELLPSVRPGIDVEITREPVGVVGIIAPWNFPSAIPAWKIAPALAHGNCVVFKPADLVPGSSWAIADILHRAGLPAGVFNLTMGRGSVVGETLLSDPRVDAITFTGSVETGRKVAQKAVAGMKKFQLEMGGKNPLVILDDADLKVAVESAINGAFFSTGQRCTASSRLIVTKGIHDRFVEAMIERMKGLVIGDALKAGVHIGPVVDQSQLNQDLFYIEEAKKEGGKLAFGGNRLERETPGFYLEPALFNHQSRRHCAVRAQHGAREAAPAGVDFGGAAFLLPSGRRPRFARGRRRQALCHRLHPGLAAPLERPVPVSGRRRHERSDPATAGASSHGRHAGTGTWLCHRVH